MSNRAPAALACLLVAACEERGLPTKPLVNYCTQSFECAPDDHCDAELNICVRQQTAPPYRFALQIVPEPSAALVARMVIEPQLLSKPIEGMTIRVPRAVTVTGTVKGSVDDRAREAVLSFVPRASALLATPVGTSTYTSNGVPTFTIALEPNSEYEVHVYPIGDDSADLPPHVFRPIPTGSEAQTLPLTYEARASFTGVLLHEDGLLAVGRKLRLEHKRTADQPDGAVVSSLGRVQADGRFELFVMPEVLANLPDYELVIGLEQNFEPWLVSIRVDGARLVPGGTITVPVVPAPIPFEGTLELEDDPDVRVASGEVRLRSSFVPPPPTGVVNNRDWCRLHLPGSMDAGFACAADIPVPVGQESKVILGLLPGAYEVFIMPGSEVFTAPGREQRGELQPATTSAPDPLFIETLGDSGTQKTLQLDTAKVFSGAVVSPLGQPMPYVTVRAQALGLSREPDGGVLPVGLFNRTVEMVTDARGAFRFPVDVGSYDFVVASPPETGFAWFVQYNRFAGLDEQPPQVLAPQTPVVVRGTLVADTPQATRLANARVDAFAIVPDRKTEGERALRIASATSDETGAFVLHLPHRIAPPEPASDAGVDLDAGIDGGL